MYVGDREESEGGGRENDVERKREERKRYRETERGAMRERGIDSGIRNGERERGK